jgi:hypothetical protein
MGGVLVFVISGGPVLAHGGGVEAVVEVASTEGGFEYGLAFAWSDGDPITGAHVVMRANQGDLVEVSEPVELSPGVYVGSLPLASNGEWQVAIAIHHPDSNGSISFVQNVGSNDADAWVVLVDTGNEERVGSVPDPVASILEPPTVPTTTTLSVSEAVDPAAETPDTTTSTQIVTPEPISAQASEVVVDIESDEKGPAIDIGLRLVHLVAIGLWLVPVSVSLFGKRNRASVVIGITGVVLTLATGSVLMLWGTPISFPGLFNPSAIADLSYGSPYVVAFAVKMAGVLLAAVATFRWAVKVDRNSAWVTLAGATLAVVAVTAMSQYHLLSHF